MNSLFSLAFSSTETAPNSLLNNTVRKSYGLLSKQSNALQNKATLLLLRHNLPECILKGETETQASRLEVEYNPRSGSGNTTLKNSRET